MNLQEAFSTFQEYFPRAVLFYGPDYKPAEKHIKEYFEDLCSDFVKLDKPKVEEVKDLLHWANLQPAKKFKVIQITSVDKVSKEAVNYLLKAIEDSPEYLKWVIHSEHKYINPALLSRSYVIPVVAEAIPVTDPAEFQEIVDLNSAYLWLIKGKGALSDTDFKEKLIGCCDALMQRQIEFPKIHLVQKYKNLIKKENTGLDHIFKSLLVQVFDAV